MSDFRVTLGSTTRNSVYDLEQSMSRLTDLQAQMSSGKAITKPSDNPTGTVQALSYQSDLSRSSQYAKNANDGLGWLGQADSVLADVSSQIQKAHTLVIQGANGTLDATARQAIADQIDTIRQSLLGDANTTYLNRPLFGGTSGSSAAYDANGAYIGDSNAASRTVGAGVKVPVTLTGPQAFGPAGSDIFSTLATVSADLRSGNTAALSGADLTALQAASSAVADAQAIVGSRYNQIQNAQNTLTASQSALQTSLASVADVDFAKVTTDFQLQQITYQAALKATSMVIQNSLANFLQ